MPIPITVPRLGWTMDEGVFERWLKQEGDTVQAGEPLFALESEKATQDIEAIDSGILRIPPDAPKPGDVVPVGAVLAYLIVPGEIPPWETAVQGAPACSSSDEPVHSPKATPSATTPLMPQANRTMSQVPHDLAGSSPFVSPTISPRALRVAQEVGVDWTQIRGTGSSGRIRERDVRAHFERRRKSEAPSPVAEQRAVTPPEGRIIALSPLRKTIAARVRAGVERAAPVTLTTQCDVTNLVRLRRQFQQANEATDLDRDPSSGQPSIAPELARHSSVPSYTDFIIKLTATALEQHPMLMAQWTDQGIRLPDGIHINVAIHTEVGLVAPVIRDVPRLTLPQIAAATRTLVELAHARRLSAEQLASGTFTITNLGMVGIDAFTPILNVPQSAVLGIGRIRRVPAVVQDQIVPRDQITFSLTFDHRVLDGVPAAKFLDTLGSLLENPASCLTAQG